MIDFTFIANTAEIKGVLTKRSEKECVILNVFALHN